MEDINLAQTQESLWRGFHIFLVMVCLLLAGFITIFSPLLVIIAGGALFLLNRRRMGQKTFPQIMLSTVFLTLAGLFIFWLSYGHSTDFSWDNFLNNSWGTRLVAFILCLILGAYFWRTTDREIFKFSQQYRSSDKISPWYGLSLFLFMISLSFVLQAAGNQIAKTMGYCYLPTLPDLSQRWFDERAEGVQKIILRPEDFGCGWSFEFQSSRQKIFSLDGFTASDDYSRTIFFRYFNRESGIIANSDVDHDIWIETELANLPEFTRMPDNIDLATKTPVDLPSINLTPPPDLMKVSCLGYDKDKTATYCQIFIVRGTVVSRLVFDAANFPHDEYWTLFIKLIQNTDKRVQAYLKETETSR